MSNILCQLHSALLVLNFFTYLLCHLLLFLFCFSYQFFTLSASFCILISPSLYLMFYTPHFTLFLSVIAFCTYLFSTLAFFTIPTIFIAI